MVKIVVRMLLLENVEYESRTEEESSTRLTIRLIETSSKCSKCWSLSCFTFRIRLYIHIQILLLKIFDITRCENDWRFSTIIISLINMRRRRWRTRATCILVFMLIFHALMKFFLALPLESTCQSFSDIIGRIKTNRCIVTLT